MRVNLLENKQNPMGRSALAGGGIGIGCILGNQHGSKGVEEFAEGSSASSASHLQWPWCVRPALVKCLQQEAYDRGTEKKSRSGRIAWSSTLSIARAELGWIDTLRLRGECVRRLRAARLGVQDDEGLLGCVGHAVSQCGGRGRYRRPVRREPTRCEVDESGGRD